MEQTQAIEQVLEPQATEENVAPTTEDTANQEGEEQQQEAKTFTQEEVNKIISKEKSKLERRIERHERQQLEAEIRAKVLSEIKPQAEVTNDKPREDQFNTYGDYLEALADWKADQKLSQWQQTQSQQQKQLTEQQEQQRQAERIQSILRKGEDKYDDFEQAVKSMDVEFSKPALLAIAESELAADITYYLATHDQEAQRLASLTPFAQAKEIGKLEDKLSSPPIKKVSKAPEPISPVTSGKAANDSLSDNMSMDAWMALRNKQLGRR